MATGEFNIQMPRVSYYDKSTDRFFASIDRYRENTPEKKPNMKIEQLDFS